MPTPAQDLNAKLRLERQLLPVLREYNANLVASFMQEYENTGNIINTAELDPLLTNILRTHYENVTDTFSNRIRGELPRDVEITEGEGDLIAEAIAAWLLIKTAQQATMINATTQENALDSVSDALDDDTVRQLVGRERQRTAAVVAGRHLERRLAARETGTLMTETQIPAEAAKATEAEVLIGVPPSVSGGSPRDAGAKKEWVTVGDSKVRDKHLAADGQEVDVNEPFIVGDEPLRWPGDSDLGASLDNVINCRCGAQYDSESIAELRRAA